VQYRAIAALRAFWDRAGSSVIDIYERIALLFGKTDYQS